MTDIVKITQRQITATVEPTIVVSPEGDYEFINNKPCVGGKTLAPGENSLEYLKIQPKGSYPETTLTNEEIYNILKED